MNTRVGLVFLQCYASQFPYYNAEIIKNMIHMFIFSEYTCRISNKILISTGSDNNDTLKYRKLNIVRVPLCIHVCV